MRFDDVFSRVRNRLALGLAAALWAFASVAAPYQPIDDSQVLERLPIRAADPAAREARELRRRLDARPGDPELAGALAQHYYRLAQRDGDPRYIGYGEAVLARWPAPGDAPTPILLARALLAQFVHNFAGAERDLGRVLERDPDHLAARSYRAILLLVQARYEEARLDCQGLAARARALVISACEPTIQAVLGEADAAYRSLAASLAAMPDAPPNERLWVVVRLAETAHRLGRDELADEHFRAALSMQMTDQYLLATYAEYLLDVGRAAQAVELLREQTRNDVLLLRLALAEQAVGAPGLKEHVATIGARIEAARRRGDELHLADEATFELRFRQNPAAAVRLARKNWDSGQREPSDARLLLETALAARDLNSAMPALEWLKRTRHEDRRLLDPARKLEGMGR